MFTSQTSSFQDSIDVEERDDFDSDDIAGYNQKTQLNCYYAIYLYQGTRSESTEESVAWNKRRADSTTSQDDFSLSLVDSSLPSEAEPELRCYISRRLSKGALLGGMGNIATVELRFTCFVYFVFVNGSPLAENTSDLVIDCSTTPPMLSNTVSNRFCDDWIQAFLNAAERCNPFLLRQILENFKLKAIQDMNSLKRFVRQAEMSHYALFRCCQFLQGCGNGDVLLQNAKAEHSDLPEACRIISVLEEFLTEPSQAHT
ncbi:unnamed protein product [Merluccius merluccius]